MVGFSNTATVTFVPFFAVPPTAATGDERLEPDPATAPRATAGIVAAEPTCHDRAVPDTDRVTALRVAHALAALGVPILRTLEVSVRDGEVTLRGRVRTYYERQLAHAHAKRTTGVRRVTAEISIAE